MTNLTALAADATVGPVREEHETGERKQEPEASSGTCFRARECWSARAGAEETVSIEPDAAFLARGTSTRSSTSPLRRSKTVSITRVDWVESASALGFDT